MITKLTPEQRQQMREAMQLHISLEQTEGWTDDMIIDEYERWAGEPAPIDED